MTIYNVCVSISAGLDLGYFEARTREEAAIMAAERLRKLAPKFKALGNFYCFAPEEFISGVDGGGATGFGAEGLKEGLANEIEGLVVG